MGSGRILNSGLATAMLLLATGCGTRQIPTPAPTPPAPLAELAPPARTTQRVPEVRLAGDALRAEARRYSVAQLEGEAATGLEVFNPYTEQQERYQGVPLGDLVARFAPAAQRIELTAVDDYQVEFRAAEWSEHTILLATSSKGARMTVADKGPVRVVIRYGAADPATKARLKPKWIWQITQITFHTR